MSKLEICAITKKYGGTTVLNPVSFTVEDGEFFFLLGPSGCGKSTLLRIIAGLLEPDGGTIRLDGRDITRLDAAERNMPMVFQNYSLWPHLNVFENIAFGLKLRGYAAADVRRRVMEMLDVVELADCAGRHIASLSGGQQQRVALARALALEPPVLLLDEPLSNLDAKLRDTMRFEIRRICKERKLTAVYVTHDRREALSMGDKIAVLCQHGEIQQIADPRTVYCKPATKFCASFLGDANFVDGRAAGADSRGGMCFDTPLGKLRVADCAALADGTVRSLMFRPETVTACGDPAAENRVDATLEESTFLGETTLRVMKCRDSRFQWYESGAAVRAAGLSCGVSIPADRIVALER